MPDQAMEPHFLTRFTHCSTSVPIGMHAEQTFTTVVGPQSLKGVLQQSGLASLTIPVAADAALAEAHIWMG